MPKTNSIPNRHPVDRLFDLREQIKALEAEEKSLKDGIMRSGEYLGVDYIAVPKVSTRHTLDRKVLESKYGVDAIAKCCKESTVTTLGLFKKADITKPSLID